MRVALVLPGQGTQYPGMATGLYRQEPLFAAAIDEVFAAFGAAGPRIRADWLARHPVIGIDDVRRSTPLLFAVDYALGRLVRGWGVEPDAVLGHSIGEVAAATLAGVFELGEIAPMIATRVEHLATAPPGAMLAVAASAGEVAGYLDDEVVVGAVNGPRQVVLAGPVGPVEAVAEALRRDGRISRRVPALSPFHSPAMAPAAAMGAGLFEHIRPRAPRLPVYSAFLGRRMTPADAADTAFWTGQPAAPVLFWPALEALLADGDHLLVEAGPGDSLTTLARLHPAVTTGGSAVVAMLGPRGGAEVAALAAAQRRLTTPASVS